MNKMSLENKTNNIEGVNHNILLRDLEVPLIGRPSNLPALRRELRGPLRAMLFEQLYDELYILTFEQISSYDS